jgi:hypothetical protein
LLYGFQQLLQGDRFFQKVQRADARGLDGGIDRRVAGHHDDRHGQQPIALPFLEQGDAIGVRHPDIEQHQVGGSGGAGFACLLRVFGKLDRVTFIAQNFREELADAHFIINYEYVRHLMCLLQLQPDKRSDSTCALLNSMVIRASGQVRLM